MKPVPSTAVGTRRPLRVPTAAQLGGRAALGVLVAVLVVGILGMHALATHETATTVGGHAPATVTHIPAAHSGTGSDARSDARSDASADVGGGSGHDMGSMAMWCAVMLAAAAVTLVLLLAVRTVRPLLPAAFQPAPARARARRWVRGTGPPHVWAFSVVRC
jgi:hypothetical protein